MEEAGGAEGQGEIKSVCSKAKREGISRKRVWPTLSDAMGESRSIRTEEDASVLAAWVVFGD